MSTFTEILQIASKRPLSEEERATLMQLLGDQPKAEAVSIMAESIAQVEELRGKDPAFIAAMLESIYSTGSPSRAMGSTAPAKLFQFRSRKFLTYAAAVILLFGTGVYLWTINKKDTSPATSSAAIADIPPGKDGAILTLADGTKIVLDSLGNGVVATEKGTEIVLKDGLLFYDQGEAKTSGSVAYNMIATPKGRQFHLILPDLTKVWLNAASSIRYPTVFSGKTREVEVTGEAYFEVASKAGSPFHVIVDKRTEIQVLGTNFNINAYNGEETVRTTLLEGAVRVGVASAPGTSPSTKFVELKPGQQARLSGNTLDVITDPDMDNVMAWRNGLFNFDNATLKDVMQQLERWYDIEVAYEKYTDLKLEGQMSREMSLTEILKALEQIESKLNFRLNGRNLIIM